MNLKLSRAADLGPLVHRDSTAALPTLIWSAWSCTVRLVVGDEAVLQGAAGDLISLMQRVDAAASRFRTDSDLSWANLNHGRPIAVSRMLIDLIDGALEGARCSDGALDPTVGADLRRLGYDRDILLVGHSAERPRRPHAGLSLSRPTWRQVRVDRGAGLLTVPIGAILDLGATAKAQTADLAAEAIHRHYGCDVLVEIGGDLAVAGVKSDWQIAVAERNGEADQQISLHSGGLATSTTMVRRWQHGSEIVHHIVDPATGRPAAGPWRTASVAAATALQANVCSTAAIVLGDRAPAWLEQQSVAARLVGTDGTVHLVGDWPC
jgi:FAD:protein FMN transferase